MEERAMTDAPDVMLDPVKQLGKSWGWFLVYGLGLSALGLVALFEPKNTAGAVAMVFGIAMILSGVFDIVAAIASDDGSSRLSGVIVGTVALILGLVVLRHIHESVAFVGLILGIYWLMRGVMMMVSAIVAKDVPGRGWRVFGGFIFTVLGAYVMGFPTAGPALIIWMLGFLFLVAGIVEIFVAFGIRRIAKAA
jgi:uncharacterized membrane protein HdeD (DUF308 family)